MAITKASKKHAKDQSKVDKYLSKTESELSSKLSAQQMNKANKFANPDIPKLDSNEDKYSKATFKAVTEQADKTDDMFSRLMDSQTVFNKQDAKLDKILHRLKSLNSSGVGSSKIFTNVTRRR